MESGSNHRGKNTHRSKRTESHVCRDDEFKGHERVEDFHKGGVPPEGDVDDHDPRDDVEDPGTDTDGVLIHVHFIRLFRVNVVPKFVPFAVFSSDNKAVKCGHGLFGRNHFGLCGHAFRADTWAPREVLGFRICNQSVAPVRNNGRIFLVKVAVLEDHECRDGLEIEEVPHGSGLLEVVRHDIQTGVLGATGLESLVRTIVAGKDDFAAFLLESLSTFLHGRGKSLAMGTVVSAEKDGNVIVVVLV